MADLKKEWYVVNTYVGQENRVKENLERRIKTTYHSFFNSDIISSLCANDHLN